jgi:hypothetical protein
MSRFVPVLFAATLLLAFPASSGAEHGNADDASPNMFHVANLPQPPEFEDCDRGSTQCFNSDLAFWGKMLAQGNYEGFRLVDISNPANPRELSVVECRANQGDLSFYKARNRLLLIQSIEEPVTTPECETAIETGVAPGTHPILGTPGSFRVPGFEGVRIFDVTDPRAPRLIAAVATACGSHTHTTISDARNQRGLVYVSSYPTGARITPLEGLDYGGPVCVPPHGKISIVEIPDRNPEGARLLKEQPLHEDSLPFRGPLGVGPGTGAVGCHDITFFSQGAKTVAGAACLEEGQLWDATDPANPTTLGAHSHIRNHHISGPGIARGLFHTASFTWDGKVVVFTDEWAGGGAHGCEGPEDTRGNVWFYDNVAPGMEPVPLRGRFILPRVQPPEDACTMHNGNVVPTNRGYVGVSSAYEAGTSVYDFSSVLSFPAIVRPVIQLTDSIPYVGSEIAFFDAKEDGKGVDDAWSSYWYNDYVYSSSGLQRPGQRGLDVYRVDDAGGKPLTARNWAYSNPQTQERSQGVGGGR